VCFEFLDTGPENPTVTARNPSLRINYTKDRFLRRIANCVTLGHRIEVSLHVRECLSRSINLSAGPSFSPVSGSTSIAPSHITLERPKNKFSVFMRDEKYISNRQDGQAKERGNGTVNQYQRTNLSLLSVPNGMVQSERTSATKWYRIAVNCPVSGCDSSNHRPINKKS
jgi:hypothetical protein